TNATNWSEVCGTAFYKVTWNSDKGSAVGSGENGTIYQGDIELSVCPPFEIFPENLYCEDISSQKSIIHAKAVHTEKIEEIWGVSVKAQSIDVFTLDRAASDNLSMRRKSLKGYATVIEKYSLPDKKHPEGSLIITAGGKLLHIGKLPYINAEKKQRGYPFIKQSCIAMADNFFGTSIIERCIPVQRAYNAVKNRKHEFLNRIAAGVLAVEDGSTDTDTLEEEGLSPGKVITYRQGSAPPQLLSSGNVPNDFTYEEDRLLNEFKLISGVSDVMRSSTMPTSLTSGIALSLLIEQDDTRLSATAEHIKNAVKTIGKHIIRLYKQFVKAPRLIMAAGENNRIEQYYFDKKSIGSDDVVFSTENEISESPAQKKSMILDMIKNGLLTDAEGRISQRMKARIADLMGFSDFENGQDLINLNIKRAAKENLLLAAGEIAPLEIDDHSLHADEHIKYMLSGEYEEIKSENKQQNFLRHIRLHKLLAEQQKTEKEVTQIE
ncbi:MAG: hypothetical protein PHE12_01675, partial [Clostridia bacterium]|nr:hypothetical protein [Clostridia bacterium]